MKMKKFSFILILALALTSCDEDDDVQPNTSGEALVSFSFSPYHNGEELNIGDRFSNISGYAVEVKDMTFYLSNIKLHNGAEVTTLSDIEIVDIRDLNLGFSLPVPAGPYDAISFDLGVPQELNGTANPDFLTSVYDQDHPLSASNGMYWMWQTGYRFFSLEGDFDTLANAADALPLAFTFHSGRDTLFRNVAPFSRAIQATGGTTVNLNFAVDVDKIFLNAGDTLDLKSENAFHGALAQMPVGIKFANNSSAAFRLLP